MALDPEKLDLTIAAATYQDMLVMVDTEKRLRKTLLDWYINRRRITWILDFVFVSVGAIVEVERLATEGTAGASASLLSTTEGCEGIVDVHVIIVQAEHSIITEVEEGREWAGVPEELRERSPRISVVSVGEVSWASIACTPRNASFQALLAVGIVDVTLLFIGEHLVGFCNLLESLLGPRRFIFVRVIFGFLNFFLWAADLWFVYKETAWFPGNQPHTTDGV
ncbi:hypothetical protein NQ318_013600 [Aromia moschata]|uniref:Uncharacterized protein n=1 Tax=Aromia moschata TaxID=1265417 RepID=A0AAV8YM30_9CUCU|nr:hypothetical protein NQ318_013600 [Aromia moschata]